jgi:hypothetical protein
VCKADHLLVPDPKATNEWSYTSTPPYAFVTRQGTNFKAKVAHTLPCIEISDQHSFLLTAVEFAYCAMIEDLTSFQAPSDSCEGWDVIKWMSVCLDIFIFAYSGLLHHTSRCRKQTDCNECQKCCKSRICSVRGTDGTQHRRACCKARPLEPLCGKSFISRPVRPELFVSLGRCFACCLRFLRACVLAVLTCSS